MSEKLYTQKIHCPHCRKLISLENKKDGDEITCSFCGGKIILKEVLTLKGFAA